MRVLVLGGTHHVGRAVVETALARGEDVTIVNRGVSRPAPDAVHQLTVDRTVPGALEQVFTARSGPDSGRRSSTGWDLVVDTWQGAPRVVRESATALEARADRYAYVSSRSVYCWPIRRGAGESAPVVVADAGSDDATDYAAAKRGGELAVLEGFGAGRALIARAGLVLGPYELVGRLPWWLHRISEGGRVAAPGPVDQPLQYVDGRDLAAWLLDAGAGGTGGIFNTVSRRGHATMGSLLAACVAATGSDAELVWVDPSTIAAAGVEGWTELPIWLPPDGEAAGMHDGDVHKALEAGLTCRPVQATVEDTWRWLQAEGDPPTRPDRPPLGLDRDRERWLLETDPGAVRSARPC